MIVNRKEKARFNPETKKKSRNKVTAYNLHIKTLEIEIPPFLIPLEIKGVQKIHEKLLS